ncbi:EAL domain-containing protein [Rhodovulum kholense]|uniref:Diguanylate cyclase (GGDEF)-like protein n=1 Tax=Rhodovulum kholense TaxID=453584 RepID=A0A8E2VIL2_9RHOB|nr:EAL domain-containing protein [Rhodovulum kholense]PTW47775.1 diguanylate cyclase (GGDEF)-like protein [Rhodovulum kholense]
MTETRSGRGWLVNRLAATGLGVRLIGIMLALFLTSVTLGVMGYVELRALGDSARSVGDVSVSRLFAINDMENALSDHEIAAERSVLEDDPFERQDLHDAQRMASSAFGQALLRLKTFGLSSEEKRIVAEIQRDWDGYLDKFRLADRFADDGRFEEAKEHFEIGAEQMAAALTAKITDITTLTRADTAVALDRQDTIVEQSLRLIVVTLAAAGGLALGAAIWVLRRLSLPLIALNEALRRLLAGDDTVRLPDFGTERNELSTLSHSAHALRDSIVETRRLAAEMKTQRALLSETVENMPAGLCMFDETGKLLVANAMFWSFFGMPKELTSGQGSVMLDRLLTQVGCRMTAARPGGGAAFASRMKALIAQGGSDSASWELDDGRHVLLQVQPVPGGWMMIASDISDRVDQEEQALHMARHDTLTGLPNRRAFADSIDYAIATADPNRPAAILFVDLDRFKHVNDTLGHAAGDKLLRHVSERLQGAVREGDTVARFGGDEFAVIQIGQQQPDSALGLGDRIIDLLSQPFRIDGRLADIGASVGIALAPEHGDRAETIMSRADIALYAAKSAGRGQCLLFDTDMLDRQNALIKLEADLKRAIELDQFSMLFQPLVNLDTGRITGAEALLRWRHPTRGLVPPAEFVPMAEELGLIVPLGALVLRMACTEAAAWPDRLNVAVNLSPVQFRRHDIVGDVVAALKSSGLPPARLVLEITEGVLLEDTDDVKDKLITLKGMGVRISLDDFGTGYSSLRYLRIFSFDKVKIDASFVQEIDSDLGGAAVVRAVCMLCGSMGIDVVAEGIETREQLLQVMEAGCNEAQGYLLGRPLAREEFLEIEGRSAAGVFPGLGVEESPDLPSAMRSAQAG